MDFNKATVLVTGANRGLGKALVAQLLKTDVKTIYAAARDPARVQFDDPRVKPVKLDVSNDHEIKALATEVGSLDLLINNAGVIEFGDILGATEAEIDRCLEVNVKGVWRVSQAFTPLLARSDRGALCNILSVLSLASMPGVAAYNLSKAAAWSATLSLRASLRSLNVSVHGVFPGPMDTDMIAGMEMDKASPLEAASEILAGIANGDEDIFPEAASKHFYQTWKLDHKTAEREFGAM